MIAATTPPRTDGTTTVCTISQRVAPRPTAPSSSSVGTPTKSSRQIDDVIGMIMIVRTSIAEKTVDSTLSLAVGEDRDPAEEAAEERLQVLRVERREHVDAPEPDHDARHGGEHLDQRPDRPAHRRRRELAQEQADRDRERRGEQDRAERRDDGADDQVARAELVHDRVPLVVPEEREVEDLDRRPRAVGDAPDDRGDDQQRRSAPHRRSDP